MLTYSYFMCFVTIVSLVFADFYSLRYDDFDIQPLLENDRVLMGYAKCFLDQGPCTPEAKDLKKVIPEAVETTCRKCTTKQKSLIRTVIKTVMDNHPDIWDQLIEKYDKEKIYRKNFDNFINDTN